MIYDVMIVGAGIFGATVARECMDAGMSVMVVERRSHIGGNCYTEERDGIIMNLYGGHIFHTRSARIWQYMSQFTEWRQYEHRVKASYGGTVYSFPPNLMTLQQMQLTHKQDAQTVLRKMFFEGYTEKQWGRSIDEVPASVIARIPIRSNWDDRYFDDPYQGLPAAGYTPMIAKMLEGADVLLNVEWAGGDHRDVARHIVYTGALDELYQHEYGRLEYRSLYFEHQRHDVPDFQGCPTMNYTSRSVDFTRRMEWKHFWPAHTPHTWVTTEYPAAYTGDNEPYYPVGDDVNRRKHEMYMEHAERDGIHVGGRLGQYRYYNMDQAVAAGLTLSKKIID
jgi:UDP-galactopyranose mutase